jgi:hypothetical protein
MKIVKINLFSHLFDYGGIVPEFINSINYKRNNDLAYQSLGKDECKKKKNYDVYSINLIPDYFNLNVGTPFGVKEVTQQNKGYLSDLKDINTIEEYVKLRFKKNASQIFRRKKRLESCLNIRYEKYFGAISKAQYDFLMASVKPMLTRRFNQRNDTNTVLSSWEELNDKLYGLVLAKKASFFVILSDDAPIQISIQYHFDKVLHGAIPAYDIDFQKFALGHIAIYEQIAWCLENNYIFFDQGYGDLDYKGRWSNCIYNYKHQIFYSKKSLFSQMLGNLEFFKITFKEYVKSMKNSLQVDKIKSKFFKEKNEVLNNPEGYQVIDIDSIESFGDLDKFDFNKHSMIKKAIIDFLYTNIEHINDVSVFEVVSEKDVYVIKGKNKIQKICLN